MSNIDPITPIDHIHKRPGMYIGNLSDKNATVNVVGELLANVIDLYLAGKASYFTVDQSDGWITVSDDGPGLPFDQFDHKHGITMVEKHLTIGHDAPTADGHFPHVHMFSQGIGMILLNALSSTLEITSYKDSIRYTQVYKDGVPVSEPVKQSTNEKNGTIFRFQLSEKLFDGNNQLHLASMRSLIFFASHQFPGFKISLQEETFIVKNGFGDLVETLLIRNQGQKIDVRSFHKSTDVCEMNFAYGIMEGSKNEFKLSFANGVPTNKGGSHEKGMNRAFRKYGITPNVAIISVVLNQPIFSSPTKAKLYVPDVEEAVERAISEFLAEEKE